MLAAGLAQCRHLGLGRVLLTGAVGNEPSRTVIMGNGGVPDGRAGGHDRFWTGLDSHHRPEGPELDPGYALGLSWPLPGDACRNWHREVMPSLANPSPAVLYRVRAAKKLDGDLRVRQT
jgi:hypothetical protein